MHVRRLSIIGVGLLGGSIGLAVRSALSDCEIIGYGHRPETLKRAQEIGTIDRGFTEIAPAVEAADLVVLCPPVGIFEPLLQSMASLLKPGAIVTDVGSTKASIA